MIDGRIRTGIAGLLLVVFALAASVVWMANKTSPAAPDATHSKIQTEFVATFIGQLTASAPAPSPTPRQEPSPVPASPTAASGTPNCLGLRFVRDVTIRDNTEMSPAEVFTKTWQVENNGTCPWKPGFQVVLIGGVAMGGSPFKVAQAVGPGGSIQISIKMVAPPNETGVVQGTWKMADAKGVAFGDFLSVVIVVKGGTRTSSTATTSPAP